MFKLALFNCDCYATRLFYELVSCQLLEFRRRIPRAWDWENASDERVVVIDQAPPDDVAGYLNSYSTASNFLVGVSGFTGVYMIVMCAIPHQC